MMFEAVNLIKSGNFNSLKKDISTEQALLQEIIKNNRIEEPAPDVRKCERNLIDT